MAFEGFRRFDPERPNYRYFPNRTRAQTVWLSWGVFALGGLVGLLYLKFSESRQQDLARHYSEVARHDGVTQTAFNQIQNQNNYFQGVLQNARRRDLGLPTPRVPLQIEEEK
ncbi:putative transmembrane protein [Toxoplasma gondii RUB]|uniref:Transmembrane protein n=10 Tax=Toxoplasma gondii TaxID=5811 RepID=S7WBW8_TOXGG|nr:hypothetical protein TGGT1_224020 [Toxoplasma gondii GT1]ESS32350.1 putative transmembrane protein [Toxoplasma gondii VEG]KAF4640455.1 hypothetical protein TGRH88_043810 [Toxoplasma gondii]KFG31373.1 putative transmembrane protein [Toxoplasma gondii p89]KFG53792.1 putative transmembrane protein [Toxoplasma gondii FOU]KFG58168.1 putative transmembrane protein [Toxoplasma gondii RUB]KFH13553.1 putative transmembrane protein [Toxoplasma gondii VAND]KFH18146.1 putative transmembrane protein [